MVAQCFSGNAAPEIVNNKQEQGWRRKDIINWLVELNNEGQRVLAGFDFAFSYPYCDRKDYFPGHPDSPDSVESLWEKIETICHDESDFYGGPFYKPSDAMFVEYLHYPSRKGKHYEDRLRQTDASCRKEGCYPSSVFKCLGPQSVGIGSIAGMRMLHYVNRELEQSYLIWPFHQINHSISVIVEIYPRLFFKKAHQNSPSAWRDLTIVNEVLRHFETDPLPPDTTIGSGDKDIIDAIVSAAAIRNLATKSNYWNPAGLTDCARAYEGWIFGVK